MEGVEPLSYERPLVNETFDLPFRSLRFMQDAVLDKVQDSDFSFVSGGSTHAFADIWTEHGRYFSVPSEGLAGLLRFKDNPQTGLQVRSIVPPATSLYELLVREQLTKSVTIDADPFETDFSAWFLLVDLVQLPKLAISLLNARPALKKLERAAGRRATANQVANSYLATQFGLLPTLDDMRTFVRILAGWARAYDRTRNVFKNCQTWHAPIKRNVIPAGVSTIPATSHLMGVDIPVRVIVEASWVSMYQTTKYYFVCPEFTGILNRIKQFVDRFGLLDPAAIWDVIPFSFIVDWFIPVGTWVHKNLKPHLFPANVVLADWCESLGRTLRIHAEADVMLPDSGSPTGIPATCRFCTATVLQYARRRQFPRPLEVKRSKPLVPNDRVMSIKRFFIGSAVGVQRVRGAVHRSYDLPGRFLEAQYKSSNYAKKGFAKH